MANISRLKDAEISNGNLINADDIDAELNQLVSSVNTLDTDMTSVTTGAYTFSGVKTFSSSPKTNGIDERTAGSGVTIDSVVCKDGFIRVPAGAGYTPATNGDFGYDSTSHTYDVYVNGAAKSLLHTGSGIDDLNDVTITTPASGQGLTYNGSAWVNGTVGSWVLLASATASSSSSVDFTSNINSTYDHYVLVGDSIRPATDNVSAWIRVYDGSFQSDASDYSYGSSAYYPAGTSGGGGSTGDSKIIIANAAHDGIDNTNAASNLNFVLHFFKPSGTSYFKQMNWMASYNGNAATAITGYSGAGQYNSSNAITGIQFLFSSGNVAVGNFYLYGVKKS